MLVSKQRQATQSTETFYFENLKGSDPRGCRSTTNL